MDKPDASQNDDRQDDSVQNDPQDDTTFGVTADDTTAHDTTADTTQREQTVLSDTTEQFGATERLDTTAQSNATERLDTGEQFGTTEQYGTSEATRAVGVAEQPAARDLFGNPVNPVDRSEDVHQGAARVVDAGDRAWPPALPERPSGPHAPAIVLGLVCLAVAGIILAQELGSLTVDWGDIGPVGIILTGAVLVLFGLVGLLTSRRGGRTS
jgi:hypothetical protein